MAWFTKLKLYVVSGSLGDVFSDATPGDSTQNVEEIFLMSQGFQMRKWCLFDVVFFLYMFFFSHGKWSSLQATLDHKKIPQKFNIAPEKW